MSLVSLAKAQKWDELDRAWQSAVEQKSAEATDLLGTLEAAVKSGKGQWAEASAWTWLTTIKESQSPDDALRLARQLLIRLPDGGELRQEVLDLYRKTHPDAPHLDQWIERSGLGGGASVRKALRYLDVALHLAPGAFLSHRTDDQAVEITAIDLSGGEVELRNPRGTQSQSIDRVIDDYQPATADDFRVLAQLRPDRIKQLVTDDPLALVIGILRTTQGHRLDRDELKVMLVPRHLDAADWSDWWTRLRNGVKKSPHVTLEGRSPMYLIFHEAGQTLEQEIQTAFDRAATPRELLTAVEDYFREARSRKQQPDAAFLRKLAQSLDTRVNKQAKHDPDTAFATALVIERLAQEGLPLPEDVHGLAVRMMAQSRHPAKLVLSAPELALWPLALACVRTALPERWPTVFADILPLAPASQCETLARAIEEAGRGVELLPRCVETILGNSARHVDALTWLWKGANVQTALPIPPLMDLFGRIMKLVGPARESSEVLTGFDVTAIRTVIRAGLSARNYARFRECVVGREEAMGAALRRQIERAEGLGPVVQDEMTVIIRENFPRLFLRARIEPWDDPGALYVTEAGRQKREAELNELVNVKLKENAIAIGKAIEHGDLSENSEYKFALEERDLLQARIAQIQMEMSLSRVLESDDVPKEHIGIGSRVRLRPLDGSGGERVFTILGPWESDLSKDIYSYQAPLVRQFLGQKQGTQVRLPDSDGDNERDYEVASFESAI